jgi:hypothetical protein
MHRTAQILSFVAALTACVDSQSPDCEMSGSDSSESGGMSTLIDTPPDALDCGETILSDSLGRSWVTLPEWGAWLQFADPFDMQAAIDSGTLTFAALDIPGGQCYALQGTAVHVCEIVADCVIVLGHPAAELPLTAADCAPVSAPWYKTALDTHGVCWAILPGDFAVRIRTDSPQG